MQPLPLSIVLLSAVVACSLPALYRLVAVLERETPPQTPVQAPQASAAPLRVVDGGTLLPGPVYDPEMERRQVMDWQLEHGLEPTGEMPALDDEDDGPLSPLVVYPAVAQIR